MDSKLMKAKILFKLARRRNWGGSHTAVEHLKKGFKSHEEGDVREIIKELIKNNWLLVKPTNYGTQVSLNAKFSEEIKGYISSVLKLFID